MSNNNAIQILRTRQGYNIANSEVEILDGQPLYHRDDNSLYIGNDVEDSDGAKVKSKIKNLYPISYLKGNSSNKSIEQASYPNSQNVKNPKANGFGSVAFGGFRGDKPTSDPSPSDTTNEAAGIQSFVAGCGNYTIGDWSFVTGKDNKNYANRSFVTGGGNRIQQGNVALSSDDKTIVLDKDKNIQFENTSTAKTNNGRFNAVFGNNNIFVSTRNNSDSKGWCESNLITGGSNIISSENGVVSRNIIGGYDNYLLPDGKAYDDSKQFNIVGGENNRIYGHLGNSIVSGSKNSIQGITTSIISGSNNNVRYLTQSLVIGKGLNAPNTVDNELPTAIIGKYNTHKPNALFVVGNGNSDSDRKNTFEVYKDGVVIVGNYNDAKSTTVFEIGNGDAETPKNAFEVLKIGGFNSYGDSKINGTLRTTSSIHTEGNLETEGYILANGLIIDGSAGIEGGYGSLFYGKTGFQGDVEFNGNNISFNKGFVVGDNKITATTTGDITAAGTIKASIFNASSDKRLKENIQPYKCAKSILDLPIYKYDYINEGLKNQIGCLAQDLQEICPEIVHEGSDGYLSIQESKIIYLLLEEVKKLREEVNSLKGV